MEPEFNDGYTDEQLEAFDTGFERLMYGKIRRQIISDPRLEWGEGLNILLLSDRALGRASGLLNYLVEKTNAADVLLCTGVAAARAHWDYFTPDILIFVGMPQNRENYQAIRMAKQMNPYVMVVMFACLDNIVGLDCRQLGIRYAFSCNKPISEGLAYLRDAFAENGLIAQREIDENARICFKQQQPEPGKHRTFWRSVLHYWDVG